MMMNYKEFFKSLLDNRLISPIWEYVIDLISDEIDAEEKDSYLILFETLFSLVDDGNICMSLNKNILKKKWNDKLDSIEVMLSEQNDFDKEKYELIRQESNSIIDAYLSLLNEEQLPSVIGKNKPFEIEDGWLYIKKYNTARNSVKKSIQRLFSVKNETKLNFDYRKCVDQNSFALSEGQEKAIKNGVNKNLIITGGPGTGKTTSILFLLLGLLSENSEKLVYLIAPSGKASSRMKESIIKGLNIVSGEYKKENAALIDKIQNFEESTIHRLLAIDYETNGFEHNKNHMFSADSIFVVDESSMIDICLFASLLEAIPSGARIFIMGDKNQLPSVECGAVFAELLKMDSLKDNIVELDESIRFTKDTDIYLLANKINNGETLPVKEENWKDFDEFEIQPDNKLKPVFYYKNYKEGFKEKEIIESVITKWAKEFYSFLQDEFTDLDPNDTKGLDAKFNLTEVAKILCAENEGNRGTKYINSLVKKQCIDTSKQSSIIGFYPGELMMINQNNKMLDLYNGDSGVLVTFKNDNTLYFMVKKSSNIVKSEEKKEDKIFKLGDYVFYPFRLITRKDIDEAYAITIHKSQGSDYKNILVILPNKKGHPLLNRQIIYTAITRTKGNTYILSNQDRLNDAKDTVMERDTNIAI